MDGKDLVNAFLAVGSMELTPRSYSGRGMYGDQCLSVNCDDATDAILETIEEYARWQLGEDPDGAVDRILELVSALKNPRTDSMGRGMVVYWPSIDWTDEMTQIVKDQLGDEDDRY